MYDLSVVTVVLNDVAGLRRTLDSMRPVLASTNNTVQHIVVDGASADGTAELAHDYAAELSTSALAISERDTGLYDAMNKGLAMATGQYVLFLNADDEIAGADVFAVVLQRLRAERPIWLISRTASLNRSREIVRLSENIPFSRWRHLVGRQMHAHPSTIIRKDVLVGLGGFDYAVAGFAADWDIVLRVARQAPQPVEVDVVLSLFAPGGLSERSLTDTYRTLGHIREVRLGGGPVVRLLDTLWTHLLNYRLRQKLRTGVI